MNIWRDYDQTTIQLYIFGRYNNSNSSSINLIGLNIFVALIFVMRSIKCYTTKWYVRASVYTKNNFVFNMFYVFADDGYTYLRFE